MKVSVIIPIFNCGRYLKDAIPQILGQTYRELELILVNDGSTDNSLELCEGFAKEDTRVKLISKEKSEGAGPARNSGIDVASGDYMMFIDADDRIEPDMIERLLNAVVTNDCDVAVCGYDTYVEGMENVVNDTVYLPNKIYKGSDVRTLFAEYFPEGIVGYLWNKIYKSELIREKNIRFPDMRRLQDGVFNIDLFDCAESCCVIEDILYHYRLNAQTDMFRKLPKNYYELIRRFSLSFTEKKKEWGDSSDEKIAVFFLNELGSCLENAFSTHWNMTKSERNEYFKSISEDEFFKKISREPVSLSGYRQRLINLLKNHSFFALGIVVKLKSFVKMRLTKIFYLIKRG